MRVYRMVVREGYEWVVPSAGQDSEAFNTLGGTSRLEGWQPIRVRRLTEDERHRPWKESDFPWLGGYAPVLRSRAVDIVRPLLGSDAEFLPLLCDDAELAVMNVVRVVDALDLDRSKVVFFPDGRRIMRFDSHVFRPEMLSDVNAFKIPQSPRGGIVYLREHVIEAIEPSGLRGFGSKLLWEE